MDPHLLLLVEIGYDWGEGIKVKISIAMKNLSSLVSSSFFSGWIIDYLRNPFNRLLSSD